MGGESQLDDGLDHILTLIKRGVKGLLHILKIKLMRSDGFYVNSTGGYRPDSCGKIVVIAVKWDDTFYWGKRPEQEYLYELNDSNILELEKSGGSWTAEVIGVPWIYHSQHINIDHENLIAVGEVESVTVESNDKGMMEMYITFREVEDG